MPQIHDFIKLGLETYLIYTFGCQMNKHDSERISGLLETLGMMPTDKVETADVVIFMTCCVREAADERLFGRVASCKNVPPHNTKRIIAIGGCIGQRDGAKLEEHLDNVDVVFGTHNISHLPQLICDAAQSNDMQVEVLESSNEFSTDLPSIREQSWHAWVPITYGCDNFCTYCIVPYVRGREKSRPIEEIGEELDLLADQGVHEVTLLGQNVNSYGRDLYGKPRFPEVLHMAGEKPIERIRFATSHPKDLSMETIDAMAEVDSVMPQLHLPVQSGSNAILKAMNRKYSSEEYLELVQRLRERINGLALSTDIIVGFPGETEKDFQDTMHLCKKANFHQAFTFIYSRRAGTPAANMAQNASHEEIQDRLNRLIALVQDSAYTLNQKDIGSVVELLVEGASKKDSTCITGRTPKNQVVHAHVDSGHTPKDYAGTFQKVRIERARTWYLSGELIDA